MVTDAVTVALFQGHTADIAAYVLVKHNVTDVILVTVFGDAGM